ncbi:MAG: cell wall hydrolase [Dongiaceae bacterium]
MMNRRFIGCFALALLLLAGCAGQRPGPMVASLLPLPTQKPTAPGEAVIKAALQGQLEADDGVLLQGMTVSAEDRRCLAQAIYFEAREESRRGQEAVGAVVLNRVRDPRFPDTICGVVQEGGEASRHRCQFSWWCDGRSDMPTHSEAWAEAQQVADAVLAGQVRDPTKGALFFHALSVAPLWRKKLQRTAQIDQHLFYR